MTDSTRREEVARALACLPSGCFVMTAAFEDKRAGMRLRAAQQCADEPLLISVSARKGHSIDPLIRDSHAFALCIVSAEDRLLHRKFPVDGSLPDQEDPFDAFGVETLVTGSPILKRSIVAFDCEVVRHFDLEADHELYVGMVVAAKVNGQVPERSGVSAPSRG